MQAESLPKNVPYSHEGNPVIIMVNGIKSYKEIKHD